MTVYELSQGKDCELVSGEAQVQYVFKSGYGFDPLPSPPAWTPPSVEECEDGCDLKPDCKAFFSRFVQFPLSLVFRIPPILIRKAPLRSWLF